VQNFKITIQYDGTNYHGWQMQANECTIQGELARVLSLFDERDVVVNGAGRTDAGVHAEGQVASFFLKRPFEPAVLRDAINGNLSRDIRVIRADPIDDSFHARYLARSKFYRYRIWNDEVVPPFFFRYVYHYRDRLDTEAMRLAARAMTGIHDFSAFTSSGSEAEDHVRKLTRLDVIEKGREIWIELEAEGFLRYMARTIAGTLIEVGRGRREAADVSDVLESRNRDRAGPTLSPAGLTLIRVDY
jgi:tRNA pseudouridine38-40 synthase